jgi:capsular exopolysaccharide synthesis family protein
VCACTAKLLAQNVGGQVCVVDANFRDPSLPDYFGVTNHRGLTDALLTEGPVCSFAKQIHPNNLSLLSCGALAPDSPNLLRTERLKNRLKELRSHFEYILIDVPAVGLYSDAAVLANLADGVVLVLGANSTRKESARKAIEGLRAGNTRLLGAVLNMRTYPVPENLYRRF